MGKILKNCLITLQRYSGKGNQEEDWNEKQVHSPITAQIKNPSDSLFGCFLKIINEKRIYGNNEQSNKKYFAS